MPSPYPRALAQAKQALAELDELEAEFEQARQVLARTDELLEMLAALGLASGAVRQARAQLIFKKGDYQAAARLAEAARQEAEAALADYNRQAGQPAPPRQAAPAAPGPPPPPHAPPPAARPSPPERGWQPPSITTSDELRIAELIAARWEQYRGGGLDETAVPATRPPDDAYFSVPADAPRVLHHWGLPANLRDGLHLDRARERTIDTVITSLPDRNFALVGPPGVGKTTLLFEIFDRCMALAPAGIVCHPRLGDFHTRFGVRLFHDSVSQMPKLLQALREGTGGLVVTARETDWRGVPAAARKRFQTLPVKPFAERDYATLCQELFEHAALRHDPAGLELLTAYAGGLPVYVTTLRHEMLSKGFRNLTADYLKRNAARGINAYVVLLLKRLLKKRTRFGAGGLHALACLMLLAESLERRQAHDFLFRTMARRLSRETEKRLDDRMDRDTFNRVMTFLTGAGDLLRFPHGVWVDALLGAGEHNPFRVAARNIEHEFIVGGIFERIERESVAESWPVMAARHEKHPFKQKESFLTYLKVLHDNFTPAQLGDLGVDLEICREVFATSPYPAELALPGE